MGPIIAGAELEGPSPGEDAQKGRFDNHLRHGLAGGMPLGHGQYQTQGKLVKDDDYKDPPRVAAVPSVHESCTAPKAPYV